MSKYRFILRLFINIKRCKSREVWHIRSNQLKRMLGEVFCNSKDYKALSKHLTEKTLYHWVKMVTIF